MLPEQRGCTLVVVLERRLVLTAYGQFFFQLPECAPVALTSEPLVEIESEVSVKVVPQLNSVVLEEG